MMTYQSMKGFTPILRCPIQHRGPIGTLERSDRLAWAGSGSEWPEATGNDEDDDIDGCTECCVSSRRGFGGQCQSSLLRGSKIQNTKAGENSESRA